MPGGHTLILHKLPEIENNEQGWKHEPISDQKEHSQYLIKILSFYWSKLYLLQCKPTWQVTILHQIGYISVCLLAWLIGLNFS